VTGNADGFFALLFERFPNGLLVVDGEGEVVACNWALQRLLRIRGAGRERRSCCSLLGCRQPGGSLADGCISERARAAGERVGLLRVQLPGSDRSVSVTAAPLDEWRGYVILEVSPDPPANEAGTGAELRIKVLGRTGVHGPGGRRDGAWLSQRPGQLLKFLVTERQRVVTPDEIAEALWPQAPFTSTGTVRHLVHLLRSRLEPDRPVGGGSRYLLARGGGYVLNGRLVQIDADEFIQRAIRGLTAFADEDPSARTRLEAALDLYTGDFLADEPYAMWAASERERIRGYVDQTLRALTDLAVGRGDLDASIGLLQRLAELDPFDAEVQRRLVGATTLSGRRGHAARLYALFSLRLQRTFGEKAPFALTDVAEEPDELLFRDPWRSGLR
jgi:DNA-binding SARP family transcriptional activator